jgi:uncharacterized membrane protein YdjX (TVP38/TMEM64 family)
VLWVSVAPTLVSWLVIAWLLNQSELNFEPDLLGWVIIIIACVFAMSLALTPTTLLAGIFGFIFQWEAVMPIVISYSSASLIGYSIANRIGANLIDDLLKVYTKGGAILSKAHKNAFFLAILSRLSPALPFAFMNVVLGVAQIKVTSFLFGGLIGMLPRTLLAIWLGANALDIVALINRQPEWGLLLVLTFIVFLGLFFLLRPTSEKTHQA